MRLKIAIVGAGIGGISAAILTARDGHDVTLFERFQTARPVGSGLVIQPVGLAVLDLIGLGAGARALSSPLTRMMGFESPSGRCALDVAYPAHAPGRAIHRSSLFQILWDQIGTMPVRIVTGATAAGTRQSGNQRVLLLEDGQSHGPYDLIIDASGAGSRLSPLQVRTLPYGAIWASVPWPEGADLPRDQLRQCYYRASQMAGLMPIGHLPGDPQPMTALFWSLPVARMEDWRKTPLPAWKDRARGLWPAMAPFLDQLHDHDQLTPARYSHGTMRRVHAPGLVFIGDAAHRASPQLGQGANMALLDALALSLALREGPLDEALPAYAAMRRWHLRLYQTVSAFLTPMYQSDSRALPVLRDRLLAPISRWPIVRDILTRLVAGDLIPPLAGTRAPSPPG